MNARTLLFDAFAQNDVDMANHRLLNLDTSNLPPVGIPPTVHPPTNQWLHDWDAVLHQWTSTQPNFRDLSGILTNEQMLNITRVGVITNGVWAATPISPAYLPTLEQILPPQNNVSMNQKRLVNLANPVDGGDAVNLGYMDFMLQGLNPKASVRLATTGQRSLAGLDLPVDGKTLVDQDRILVKDQFIVRDNGIYIAQNGSWQRATDADHGSGDTGETPANDINRAYCTVREGNVNAGSSWVNSTPCVHMVDVSPGKIFVLFSVAPIASVLPGNGLNEVGNTLNVLGTPNRIKVAATVDIDPAYAGQSSITTLGTINAGTWQGDVITPAHGGTGMVNVGTLTLNNVSLVAVRDGFVPPPSQLAFHTGGDTNVTLPLSGKLASLDGVETFTNKAITRRIQKIASNSRPSVSVTDLDAFYITALSEDILSMTDNLTGAPTDCQELVFWIKDNGVSRAISWGTAYDASPDLPLPNATTVSLWLFLRFIYQTEKVKWVLVNKINHIPL